MLRQSPLNNLGKQVNDIHDYLKELEATVDEGRQKFLVRRILVECCDLLTSIDKAILRERLLQTFQKADEQAPDWREKIFNDDDSFYFFLNVVENKLLEKVGFDKDVRERILLEIGRMREYAINQSEKITPESIIASINSLQNDVCAMKEKKLIEGRDEEKAKNRRIVILRAVKTLAFTVIVVDAFAPPLFPWFSEPAANVSITLGAALQGIG